MSDNLHPYQDIVNKYASSLNPPQIIPQEVPKVAPIDPVAPQSASRLTTFFKITAIVSFLLFLGVTGKVAYNMYNKINAGTNTDLQPAVMVSPTAIPTPSEPMCQVNDTSYKVGESFEGANTNTCTCQSDLNITCTEKTTTTTQKPSIAPTLAPTSCLYSGKKYEVGESYKQDCNSCLCLEDGTSACTKKACPKM